MKDKQRYNDGLLRWRWRENKDKAKQTLIKQPVFGHLETLLLLGWCSLEPSVCARVCVCACLWARAHTQAATTRVSPANIKNEVVSGQLGLSQEAVGSHATCSSEDRPRRGGEREREGGSEREIKEIGQ